jgi:hypothetical protein
LKRTEEWKIKREKSGTERKFAKAAKTVLLSVQGNWKELDYIREKIETCVCFSLLPRPFEEEACFAL